MYTGKKSYIYLTVISTTRNTVKEMRTLHMKGHASLNPLNAELNPICHLLALLGAHHILHISRIRVKILENVAHATEFY
jgi:hypothetical protein